MAFSASSTMPLFPCFSKSSAEQPTPKHTAGDRTHLARSSSDMCSSVSGGGSIQTFPSLPTLHVLPLYSQNAPPSSSAIFSLISSLNAPLLKHPSHSAPTLAVSSNFLYSFSESSIAIYDLTDLRQVFTLPPLPTAGAVKSVTVSVNAVITAHQDGKIRTWSRNSGKIRLISTLPTLSDRISRFAIPSSYVTIRRHTRRLWISHADAVSAVSVAGGLLYSVSWDKTLKIWRLSDLKCLQSLTAHDDAVNAVAVGPDGAVYTGSADRAIKVWAPRSGQPHLHVAVATLVRHKSAVNALAVSGDGKILYSGSRDRSILVWEREESANYMSCVGVLRGHVRAVLSLSTVGIDLVVSGSADRTVRIWRRGEGYCCLCVLEGHVRGVRSVVAEREEERGEGGYWVCSGSLDGEVRVWRVRVENGKGSDKKL